MWIVMFLGLDRLSGGRWIQLSCGKLSAIVTLPIFAQEQIN